MIAAVFITLWLAIYQDGDQLTGFAFADLVAYYFIVSFIDLFASDDVGWILNDDIREGNVLNFIPKPLRGFRYWFSLNFGIRAGRGMIILPLYVIALIIFLVLHVVQPLSLLLFFGFFAATLLLGYSVYFFLGSLAFLTDSAWGFILGWIFVASFLGGRLLPIDAFPRWLADISLFLPFQYFYYVPARILTGDFSQASLYAVIVVTWILAFYAGSVLLWRYGTRHYEAFGR